MGLQRMLAKASNRQDSGTQDIFPSPIFIRNTALYKNQSSYYYYKSVRYNSIICKWCKSVRFLLTEINRGYLRVTRCSV